jgi:hypothetical protein
MVGHFFTGNRIVDISGYFAHYFVSADLFTIASHQ